MATVQGFGDLDDDEPPPLWLTPHQGQRQRLSFFNHNSFHPLQAQGRRWVRPARGSPGVCSGSAAALGGGTRSGPWGLSGSGSPDPVTPTGVPHRLPWACLAGAWGPQSPQEGGGGQCQVWCWACPLPTQGPGHVTWPRGAMAHPVVWRGEKPSWPGVSWD